MLVNNSISFGARFLSDVDRDITYDYSQNYCINHSMNQDLRMTKLESTGNYNNDDMSDQNFLDEDINNMD